MVFNTIKIIDNNPEYLSTDILDEEFMKIFKSLYRLQYIMGSCRVDAKHRFVTPPTRAQKCYTILCVLGTLSSAYTTITVYFERNTTSIFVLSLGKAILLSHYTAYFCNVIHTRFINNHRNVDFHVRLQKLDRLMKIDQCKAVNTTLRRVNEVSVVLISLAMVTLILAACAQVRFEALNYLGGAFCILNFILEIVALSSLVLYFVTRLRYMNCIIENYLNQENVRYPNALLSGKKNFILSLVFSDNFENNNFSTSETNIHLSEIFRCFTLFQDLYRVQLLLFCLKLIVLSLMSFEMVIYTSNTKIFQLSEVASLIVFVLMDTFIAIFLAFRFQIFYSQVKETKRLCISVMAMHQHGPLREKARNMLKVIEETPPRFSIYDMWDVNAGMFITIFCLVTGFMVTLIQFTVM